MGKALAWFLGLLSGIVITAGAEAAVVAFLPSKTYLNSWGTTIVGENIGSKGVLGIVQNVNEFTIDDLPIIKETLDKMIAEGGLGKYAEIDYEAIKTVKLTDPKISEKIQAAIKITATLKSLNIDLGSFGNLSIFKTWKEVTPTQEEINKNYKAYYYRNGDAFLRAYDDDKTRVAPEGAKLYLPNLSELPVVDLMSALSVRLGEITYPEFMKDIMGMSQTDLEKDAIYKIVGDAPLQDLKNLDIAGVKLVTVLEKSTKNAMLFDLLVDVVPGKTKAEDITLGDLSSINIDNAHLTAVLPHAGNETLYDVLCDMKGLSHDQYGQLTISALSTVNMGGVKLSSLLVDPGDNAILSKLLSKGSTVSSLSSDINSLTVHELFGGNCFTVNVEDAIRDTDKYKIQDNKYVYDPAGTYYISKDAGVWLIFAYQASDIYATTGRANTFSPATTTFESLQKDPSSFSGQVGNSYIYQLVSAGLISGTGLSDLVTSQTLNGILGSM